MSMPHKPLSRKAPDGLLQISDRVYVFDSCLTLEYDWSEERYKGYMDRVVGEFGEKVHDASIMVCNFREEETNTKTSKNFCKHNVTVIDYPGQHHGCPVPKMETIHQFLKLCENWLSRGEHNVLLMHCEHGGGWPVLAFMLAALLTFRKQSEGEEKALDMVYKQAPRELLHLMMPLDPIPSQLRYLQYVSSWNVALDWPPLDRALRLDCIILRYIPNFDGKGGCHPMFRIYGQDPALADKSSKILYSMPKRAKNVRAYKQGEYELIIVDINCHVQGDVLIESINLNDDMESEQMMFHAMFNTAFLRSNILMLNRDKVDVLWDAKDHFPKDFRAEILFSEIDTAAAVPENGTSWFEDKEGLPVEAFSKAQEIFSDGDWMSPREDPALQQRRASDIIHDKLDTSSDQYVESGTILHQTGPKMPQEKKNEGNSFLPSNLEVQSVSSTKQTPDNGMNRKEDKTIKVDATFSHQTAPKMPQEKKNEANSFLPSNLEVQSMTSTKQTKNTDMSKKENKIVKVDATPPRSSCSDSTTFLHQTGPEMPQEKRHEANCFLPSNLEIQSVISTNKTLDNTMSRKEDKTIKVDATPPRSSCSDSTTFLHQTSPRMAQEKKGEANSFLPSNLEVQSMTSNKQIPGNEMSKKENKIVKVDATPPRPSCSDSTTFLHQTGPKMPQEKKNEANCFLPSNLEIQSVSSTKQTLNNNMSRKEDKIIKVDATPPRPSYSDSTTFLHQRGPKMPQEKKNEENCFLPSNLEIQSMSSTKQTPNNDMSKKENQTNKFDATPPRSGCSDSQTYPKMPQEKNSDANSFLPSNLEIQSVSSTKQIPDNGMSRKEDKTMKVERTSESSNCVTDSKNLNTKQHSPDLSLPGSVDTSPTGPISPQTPPSRPRVTRSAKEVHDSPPHMESHPHHVLPLKSRNPVTEETKSQSQDRSQSFNFSTTAGTPSSCTFQNKSQTDVASHPPTSAMTSTQPPIKKILPVRTRPDSSLSKPQTPLSPHTPPLKEHEPIRARPPPSPPTPPPKDETHLKAGSPLSPPTPPQPPCLYGKAESPTIAPPPPPPPPSAELSSNDPNSSLHKSPLVPAAPAIPPPPAPISDNGFPVSLSVGGDGNNMSGTEGHRSSSSTGSKGRILTHTMSSKNNTKKLKPLHWLKISRAVKGSLWDETQKSGEASKAPEIDMSELESLFSAAVPSKGPAKKSKVQSSVAPKSDKVQLIDHTRAYNCEILLSKVKVPLQDLMSSVLALEESALDTDQVENLIKFCPTKEEIEVLKGYTGEKEKLGRCEQFFLELMKVPRVESKLRVFSFKIQFHSQVSDLRNNLHVVNAASEEIRNSVKLRRIMQTILSLGNALNQGTAKGSAIGFRLDSLLKLTETRSRNNKITLVHYLCKVLADKLPEVLDFSKDLANLEPAAKIQLKFLAEEMQAIRKGLEKVKHEQSSSEDDGPISETFCKNLKEFLCSAEVEVSSLASLYSVVGGNMDALIIYFGEDPSRCPFEQVVTTLLNFTGMFNKAHEENCNQLDLEMKKTEESETKK